MIKQAKYQTLSAGPSLSIVLTENGDICYWGDNSYFFTERSLNKKQQIKLKESFEFQTIKLEYKKEKYLPIHVQQGQEHIGFLGIRINNKRRKNFSFQEVLDILASKQLTNQQIKILENEDIRIFTTGLEDNGRLGRSLKK